MEIAKILQNIDFYLPVFMDFRGRIYPVTSYFSYQGSDLERSLIEFAEGCYLNDNANNYVYQQLANTAGHSKLTIASKKKWSCQFIKDLNIKVNAGPQSKKGQCSLLHSNLSLIDNVVN